MAQPVDNAPVEKVGGPQDKGPWPSEVEEIATGKAYNRPVTMADGSVQSVQVTVKQIEQIVREGEPTDGYIVRSVFEDPTL